MTCYRTPSAACPVCGYLMDACTALDNEKPRSPKPNDISICLECAAVLAFTDDLKFREATPDDYKGSETIIRQAQHLIFKKKGRK
jgi:hypothetical protein